MLKKPFKLIIAIIILFSTFSIADQKQTLGLLSTKMPVYDHEFAYTKIFDQVAKAFNIELYIVDYHSIYSQYLLNKTSEPIENILLSELEKHNVKKVIIPGNHYNIDTDPHEPLPNRQMVTEALVKLSKFGKVKLLGICGGMQGVLHADGIKIVSLKSLGKHQQDHIISKPSPYLLNVKLNRIMVNPASKLAKLINNDKIEVTNNGWIILNVPDYHSETVSLEKSNLRMLEEKGYKIVGFDQNGVIEILEDKFGNFYFQSHPEGLVINKDEQNNYNSKSVEGSIIGIVQFFEHFINDK